MSCAREIWQWDRGSNDEDTQCKLAIVRNLYCNASQAVLPYKVVDRIKIDFTPNHPGQRP